LTKRLKIGGGAQFDGVMIRGEHFSATVRRINGEDPHCELIEEKIDVLPKWLENIGKIPLLRGVALPLLLAWQLKKNALMEVKTKNLKEPSLAEKIIGLAMLLAIFVPFIWIAKVCFQPGLLSNLVSLTPLLLLLGIGIVWMRKRAPEILKYHGAEHKAVRMYDDTGKLPDVDGAVLCSRFHPRCGSCLIANWFASLVVLSLAFPNLSGYWIALAIMVISTELMAIAKYGLLGKVLNSAGLALQGLTTIEPEEKQLRVAVAATRAVLILETAQELPELPRTRRFEYLDELEIAVG
jgi:uncharacterized protein YqhQ